MKKIFLLILTVVLVACENDTKDNTDYNSLIGKPLANEKVDSFLKELGSDYEFDDQYGSKSYIYENKGVELNISNTDTLEAIFFNIDKLDAKITLPLSINSTDTRKNIEEKFGKPDRYFQGLDNLNAYYLKNDLVVKFKSKDTNNMNNGIKQLSIQKLDRKRVLGTK